MQQHIQLSNLSDEEAAKQLAGKNVASNDVAKILKVFRQVAKAKLKKDLQNSPTREESSQDEDKIRKELEETIKSAPQIKIPQELAQELSLQIPKQNISVSEDPEKNKKDAEDCKGKLNKTGDELKKSKESQGALGKVTEKPEIDLGAKDSEGDALNKTDKTGKVTSVTSEPKFGVPMASKTGANESIEDKKADESEPATEKEDTEDKKADATNKLIGFVRKNNAMYSLVIVLSKNIPTSLKHVSSSEKPAADSEGE